MDQVERWGTSFVSVKAPRHSTYLTAIHAIYYTRIQMDGSSALVKYIQKRLGEQ